MTNEHEWMLGIGCSDPEDFSCYNLTCT